MTSLSPSSTSVSTSLQPFNEDEDSIPEYTYRCTYPEDATTCAVNCTSVVDCDSCQCAVVATDASGPWGEVMDVIFCLVPIVFLVFVTIKKSNPMPTTRSLPIAAALLYLVRLMYLASDPLLCTACIISGLHEALTPLSIMAGAITLFETMEATYCLPFMMREIKTLTAGHPVAECMLLFSFVYTVEGASGFGTPTALGAPMLVSTGHDPFKSVVVLLIFNTFSTVWGAVGTPIWFGFGELQLSESDLITISGKAAVALAVSAFAIVPWVLTVLVPWKMVRHNLAFVYVSMATCIGPSLGMAMVNYEFPSLLGGLVGCAGTALAITFKIGLKDLTEDDVEALGRAPHDFESVSEHGLVRKFQKSNSVISDVTTTDYSQRRGGPDSMARLESLPEDGGDLEEAPGDAGNSNSGNNSIGNNNTNMDHSATATESVQSAAVELSLREVVDEKLGPRKSWSEGYLRDALIRTFPIWGVVLLLILTRVEQIGIKPYLIRQSPYFSIHFGTYGTFRLSASLVFQLRNILTYPGLNWRYELLYVPFLMPFVFVSFLTMLLYRKDMSCRPQDIVYTVANRLSKPTVALLGALCLVQLMIRVETAAPAFILGTILADWFKQAFVIISPLLGALGSFFSGSTTVSNLTFGVIQNIAAESIKTSATTMLALQTVGASAANGICLNNIISACAVVGLKIPEGRILMQTYKFVFSSTTICTIVMLAFFFRFG